MAQDLAYRVTWSWRAAPAGRNRRAGMAAPVSPPGRASGNAARCKARRRGWRKTLLTESPGHGGQLPPEELDGLVWQHLGVEHRQHLPGVGGEERPADLGRVQGGGGRVGVREERGEPVRDGVGPLVAGSHAKRSAPARGVSAETPRRNCVRGWTGLTTLRARGVRGRPRTAGTRRPAPGSAGAPRRGYAPPGRRRPG